jgi:integrase
MEWIGTWSGGRIRQLDDGTLRWYIRKRLGAAGRVTIALDVECQCRDTLRAFKEHWTPSCGHHDAAMAELSRFRLDPAGFKTRKQHAAEALSQRGGVALDADSLGKFLAHANARVSKGELSKNYVHYELTPYCGDWATALGGKPLAKVRLADLKTALRGWKTAHHKRIVAIKAWTAWLREEGRLSRSEDPTLDLKVPTAKPRPVGERAFTAKQVEGFYGKLRDYEFSVGFGEEAPDWAEAKEVSLQPVRDVFVLRAKAGLHGSEISRLARGEGSIRVLKNEGEIAGTLVFPHKHGGEHVVSVDQQTLAAAQRLRASGKAPDRVRTARAVARVIKAHPELEGFSFENLRHSFITLGVGGRIVTPKGGGVSLEMIAQVAGHSSVRTTRRHYLGAHVPAMIVVPAELTNADDLKLRVGKPVRGLATQRA